MNFIIQTGVFPEHDDLETLKALKTIGARYSTFEVCRFYEIERFVSHLKEVKEPTFIRCSLQVRKWINENCPDYFWPIFDLSSLSYCKYPEHFSDELFNHPTMISLEDFRENSIEIFKEYGKRLFIRPNENDKLFTGKVFEISDLHELSNLSRDTILVISKPKDIISEYRVFTIDGRVVSMSRYNDMIYNKPSLIGEEEILSISRKWAKRIPDSNLPNVIVMDVVEHMREDFSPELKIMEFSHPSTCSWYLCDHIEIYRSLVENFKAER